MYYTSKYRVWSSKYRLFGNIPESLSAWNYLSSLYFTKPMLAGTWQTAYKLLPQLARKPVIRPHLHMLRRYRQRDHQSSHQ